MHKHLFQVVVGFLVLLSIFSTADVNTHEGPCPDVVDCEFDLGPEYYCNTVTATCFRTESIPAISQGPSPTVPISVVNQSPMTLEIMVVGLQNDLATVKQDLHSLQGHLSQVDRNIQEIRQKTDVPSETSTLVSTLATGLAGIQQKVDIAGMEVSVLQENVAEERDFTQLIKYGFFTLLILAIAAGIIYYLNRDSGSVSEANPEIVHYITKHITEGKKFSFIKESLLRAGWGEGEIVRAYKETLRHNYQQYLQRKGGLARTGATGVRSPASLTSRPMESDKNKMISIAVVSVLLLIGVFFLLSGVVGKAVFFQQTINNETREVGQLVQCTPPHILTPDGNSCCTDLNANTICDETDERLQNISAAVNGRCTDNLQCQSAEYCINAQCESLYNLYKGSPLCGKMCNFYTMEISTSDHETYNLKPKRGSYSCAGALEWKIMELPNHCEGEKAVVPIMVTMKEPGRIISEEVVVLRQRESTALVHPTIPGCSLTLTMEKIYELCE